MACSLLDCLQMFVILHGAKPASKYIYNFGNPLIADALRLLEARKRVRFIKEQGSFVVAEPLDSSPCDVCTLCPLTTGGIDEPTADKCCPCCERSAERTMCPSDIQ